LLYRIAQRVNLQGGRLNEYVLLVHGTSDEVAIAKNIIQGASHITYAVHSEPVYAF